MTDKEKIVEMFTRAKVDFREFPTDDNGESVIDVESVHAGTEFTFDTDGSLLSVYASDS